MRRQQYNDTLTIASLRRKAKRLHDALTHTTAALILSQETRDPKRMAFVTEAIATGRQTLRKIQIKDISQQ